MNSARFLELSEIYGADLDRWPSTEQPAARAWLASEPAASQILAHARALDARLVARPHSSPPLGLEQDIVASLCARQAAARTRSAWVSAVVSLAVVGAGTLVGLAASPPLIRAHMQDQVGAGAGDQTSFGRLIAEATPLQREAKT